MQYVVNKTVSIHMLVWKILLLIKNTESIESVTIREIETRHLR